MRSSPRRFARVAAALLAASSLGAAAADIDALWEYDDPAASEARFRAALVTASGDDRLELLTQLARTDSLRGRFAEAHRVLELEWNRRGLALANASRDAKARSLIPAMLNNSAWDLQALGRREEALSTFEAAERAWSARGGARQVAIAKWSVAYCLRSLDRPRAALVILAPLASARASDTQLRRDVLEEIALDALAVAGLGVAR
jgi:tetratricopeptide (TPR) repeat protein